MNGQNSNVKIGKRLLFGIVSAGMFIALADGVAAGQFNMHGDAYRRIDHPIGFWLYAIFLAALGLSGAYVATVGNRQTTGR